MASPVEEVPVETLAPTADVVGNAFVQQYYHILHKSPELVHRFYQDKSSLSRAEENGMMSITTSMEAINEKILSLDYGNLRSEITAVDAQDSFSGGVFVLVNGYMIWRDNSRKYFAQSFFLAPQDTGYYVLNDVFRYVDDFGYENGDQAVVNYDEEPLAIEPDCSALPEVTPEIAVVNADETVDEKLSEPENGEELVAEEEAPISEVVVVEIPDYSQLVECKSKTEKAPECKLKTEEAPKKSYASILGSQHVKAKATQKNVVPLSAPPSAPARIEPKNQEQVVAALTPVPVVETLPTPNPNVTENGDIQEVEEGYSIYIKGLPLNATNTIVEAELKKFGAIKSNGVQIRLNKGFCFGFVEFEAASSVRSALEASPILISGRLVAVEEKRSTFRGNNGRGRFPGGRGNSGYRNDGATRGRFHGGGRGYGRNDFNGGGDFGNRNENGYYNGRGDFGPRNSNTRVGPRHGNNGRADSGDGFGDSVHGTGSSPIRVSATA